ncbi:MAG: hypothetical protein K0S32_750 [Bacteroidetes bacterium]|jgi:outer membrane protein OmpA-like peptidoglycan-associated protein/tetratricopeptide (TPR) repeat protein|nr:hypothetical protein [Bacteroidota bacterium]
MSKRRSVLAVILIFSASLLMAQATDKGLVGADKQFIKMSYKEAAASYEKYLKKHPKDFYASRQAAICYGKLGDQNKAIDHWTNAMESSQATDRDRLDYAKSLLANYRTEDAKRVIVNLRSSSDAVAGKWGRAYADGYNFNEDSILSRVHLVPVASTPKPEYSPVYYKDHLIYVTELKKPSASSIFSSERYDTVDVEKGIKFNSHIQKKNNINGAFCFTPDDSTLYFTRTITKKETKKKTKNPNATSMMQLFSTAMNSYGLAHQEIHPFIYNSFDYHCMHPSISADGKKLYFASDMPGTLGGTDIFVCEWKDGNWDKPKNLGTNINSAGNESYPHISEEGLLYFVSDGWPGMGGLDLFYADPTKEGGFTEAENLGATMNTQFDDFGLSLMKGKPNKGYLSSNRKAGTRDYDIYYFVNNKPRSFPAKIMFYDSLENKSMSVSFTLNIPSGTYDEKLDSGKIYNARIRPGKALNISAVSENYVTKNFFKNPVEKSDTMVVVQMRPKSRKCIEGKIIDKDNNKPLAGVKVAIYDEDGNKYLDYITDSTGNYSICNLPLDKALYIGSQKKPDYFSNTDKFFIKKNQDLLKDIFAMKIVVGKAIKVDNIYFDVGKFNVRPDAALELDKLVALMKDNPEIIIELSSHTDCNGAAAANMSLSDKRAKSSAAYIISKGIAKNRIKGKGYGESKLVNDCKCEGKKPSTCSEEQHAQNRRAEIKVTGFIVEKAKPADKKPVAKKKGK